MHFNYLRLIQNWVFTAFKTILVQAVFAGAERVLPQFCSDPANKKSHASLFQTFSGRAQENHNAFPTQASPLKDHSA
jgi:hypothetical protein